MGHPESDLSQITVPTEDEAIPRAFAELEENISAWSGAISDAHRKLEQLIEQARRQQAEANQAAAAAKNAQASLEAQSAASKADSQAVAKSAATPQAVDNTPAAQATTPKAADAEAPNKQPAPTKPKSDTNAPPKYTREMAQSDTDDSNKKRGKSLGGLFVRKKATDNDTETAPKTETSVKSKADDPDEALLATLDEKTAQAIRIKRRLLNKSVRELLDEMK